MASLVAKALLAVALLSTLAPSLCAGMITELKVEHDDRAIVLIARPFGFNKPDGASPTAQTAGQEAVLCACRAKKARRALCHP